jgi:hypothetical protein
MRGRPLDRNEAVQRRHIPLCQFVAVGPRGAWGRACEACIGGFVVDKALGLRIELKIDVQILGDGAEVQHLGEHACDAER